MDDKIFVTAYAKIDENKTLYVDTNKKFWVEENNTIKPFEIDDKIVNAGDVVHIKLF